MIDKATSYRQLIDQAKQASQNACCPYSDFPVGAALLTPDGAVYTGPAHAAV